MGLSGSSKSINALPVHLLIQVSKIAVSSRRNTYFQKLRVSIWEPFLTRFRSRFGSRFGVVLGAVWEWFWGSFRSRFGSRFRADLGGVLGSFGSTSGVVSHRFGNCFGVVSKIQNLFFELGGRPGLLKSRVVLGREPFWCRFGHSKLVSRARGPPGAPKIHSRVRTSAAHERAKRAQCAKRRESVRIPGDCCVSVPFR